MVVHFIYHGMWGFRFTISEYGILFSVLFAWDETFSDLHEGALIYNIKKRFTSSIIYVSPFRACNCTQYVHQQC